MAKTTRLMIETTELRDGYIAWAVLVPDTRKSGKHRLFKWRTRAFGHCPQSDLTDYLTRFALPANAPSRAA